MNNFMLSNSRSFRQTILGSIRHTNAVTARIVNMDNTPFGQAILLG